MIAATSSLLMSSLVAKAVAEQIGYPLLVKAAVGGGGKGMRTVHAPEELPFAVVAARREAQSTFGDGAIYLERLVEGARHIEVQILGDEHGNIVNLGERECSLQRRHQKLLEEAPSMALAEDLRAQLGEAAIALAEAVNYTNVGTVEFLLVEDGQFYFLEVNARLQVEHPVTEMVTGIDLVKEQIRVAAGQKLSFAQEDIEARGWALECRIYAEDPENDFFPSTGKIGHLQLPNGPWVRNDSSLYTGMEVSVYYDPLLSKLMVWGKDRQEALDRMLWALGEYHIAGIKTTIGFCGQVLIDPKFVAGTYDTRIIPELTKGAQEHVKGHEEVAALAAALVAFRGEKGAPSEFLSARGPQEDPWKMAGRKRGMAGGLRER